MESRIDTLGQDARLQEVAQQVGDLPSLPAAAAEVLRQLDDPSVSADDLQRVIGRDQALAAHILRIANSAMYCLQRQVSVLSHAIAILGLDTLRSVVVAASIRSVFYSGRRSEKSLPLHVLWEHAWGAAMAAQSIARRTAYRNSDEAFTCGLVHDLGKLVMWRNHSRTYLDIMRAVDDGGASFCDVERELLGFTHAQVGALLAMKWCFPVQLVEGILHHHDLAASADHLRLTRITSLANKAMIRLGIGLEKDPDLCLDEDPCARLLGMEPDAVRELLAETGGVIVDMPDLARR